MNPFLGGKSKKDDFLSKAFEDSKEDVKIIFSSCLEKMCDDEPKLYCGVDKDDSNNLFHTYAANEDEARKNIIDEFSIEESKKDYLREAMLHDMSAFELLEYLTDKYIDEMPGQYVFNDRFYRDLFRKNCLDDEWTELHIVEVNV